MRSFSRDLLRPLHHLALCYHCSTREWRRELDNSGGRPFISSIEASKRNVSEVWRKKKWFLVCSKFRLVYTTSHDYLMRVMTILFGLNGASFINHRKRVVIDDCFWVQKGPIAGSHDHRLSPQPIAYNTNQSFIFSRDTKQKSFTVGSDDITKAFKIITQCTSSWRDAQREASPKTIEVGSCRARRKQPTTQFKID